MQFNSEFRWAYILKFVFVAAVAIEWFGLLHGLGVAAAMSFLAPPHPSEGAATLINYMIGAKKNGLL